MPSIIATGTVKGDAANFDVFVPSSEIKLTGNPDKQDSYTVPASNNAASNVNAVWNFSPLEDLIGTNGVQIINVEPLMNGQPVESGVVVEPGVSVQYRVTYRTPPKPGVEEEVSFSIEIPVFELVEA
jgi:hypothetical protein